MGGLGFRLGVSGVWAFLDSNLLVENRMVEGPRGLESEIPDSGLAVVIWGISAPVPLSACVI